MKISRKHIVQMSIALIISLSVICIEQENE